MVNDRDNKYEGQDDSEYHFSDEEVSYEVETDSNKAAAPAGQKSDGVMARFSRSKRMLISLVVFLVLVFVVYKMVAPPSTAPSTDITAAPPVAQNTAPVNNPPAMQQQAQSAQSTAPAVAQNTTPPQQAMANSQPVATPTVQPPAIPGTAQQPNMAMPTGAPVVQPEVVQQVPQQVPQQQMTQQQMTQQQMPQQQMSQQMQQQQMPQQMQQQQMPQQMQQQQLPQQQVTQQQMQQQMPQQQMPQQIPPQQLSQQGMQQPGVIPVQSAVPIANQVPGGINAGIAATASESDRLMGQLNSDYTQKLNDFTTQNKALQDEVQTLNSRVASMETQMNQLVQALTRQNQPGASAPPPPVPEIVTEPSRASAYSVQAIIPGRAWLRLDNGETVTVAEGDMIKDLGRVTKIDPYDGVVEINTGSKVISLSYGNGG